MGWKVIDLIMQTLIVALDFDSEFEALSLVDKLDPEHCAVKIGHELFTLLGPKFVKTVVSRGFKVFLDLKYHDIPNTVGRACKVAAELGIWMMNVHAAGGMEMMKAARQAVDSYGMERPLLIAVTVLTSMGTDDLASIGIPASLASHARFLANLAHESQLDGVVSSALEVPLIKQTCGQDFLTVTPGIRLSMNKTDDQTRIITPDKARKLGSDFIVVGRPVTRAADPLRVINEIHDSFTK